MPWYIDRDLHVKEGNKIIYCYDQDMSSLLKWKAEYEARNPNSEMRISDKVVSFWQR